MTTTTLIWQSEQDTEAFAKRLALNPLLREANIQLSGDLGAGKSTLARHMLRALGVVGNIKSPTYAVVEEYLARSTLGPLKIWHFDFYRFSDPAEWLDAGFKDIFLSEGLKISEWSEKAKGFIPEPDLHIDIEILDGDKRQATIKIFSDKGQLLLN